MSYKVIHFFTDLQDFDHPYDVGDNFPRAGVVVSESRLKELSGNKNRQGKPLIELCVEKEVVQVEEKSFTKTDINRMSTADLKDIALSNGIEGAGDMTGADLKKALIKKLGL